MSCLISHHRFLQVSPPLQQVALLGPTSLSMHHRDVSILQIFSDGLGKQICCAHLVKKQFAFRRGSHALRCCSLQTRVVDTLNNSTKPSVTPPLMSKNSSWSDQVSVPTWSRLFVSFSVSVSASFKFQDPSVRTGLQMYVRCIRAVLSVASVFHTGRLFMFVTRDMTCSALSEGHGRPFRSLDRLFRVSKLMMCLSR